MFELTKKPKVNLRPEYCTAFHKHQNFKILKVNLCDKLSINSNVKNIYIVVMDNKSYSKGKEIYMGYMKQQYAILIPKLIVNLTVKQAFIKVNSVNLKELATLHLLGGKNEQQTTEKT